MPRLAKLGNIEVRIYYLDTKKHKAPHFHALAPGREAVIGIPALDVIAGDLKGKPLMRVLDWAAEPENAKQLVEQWNASNPHQKIKE